MRQLNLTLNLLCSIALLSTASFGWAATEEERAQANRNLANLTEHLGMLSDQMRAEQDILVRLAESQAELRPYFERIAELDMSKVNLDDATRSHIRNLDGHLERLLGEVTNGRDHLVKEIRSEIRLLARTIAAIAEETEQG